MTLRAEIISIGTELIIGHTVNTNASYISEKLGEIGVSVFFHTSVGDNHSRIHSCIDLAKTRSDLIIFTGGLGPTDDDISHDVIAENLRLKIELDEKQKFILEEKFQKIGIKIPEIPSINYRQARVIESAKVINNPIGTAIGMYLEKESQIFISFPGVPCEMEIMLGSLLPDLKELVHKRDGIKYIVSKKIKMTDITESSMAQTVIDYYNSKNLPNPFLQSNPSLAPYANLQEVYLRITAGGKTEDEAIALQSIMLKDLRSLFPEKIFGYDDDTLDKVLAKTLKDRSLTISFAESCTGGLASKLLTDLPGASDYMKLSLVVYSNQSKKDLLGVQAETLEKHGAVSLECAEEMAIGLSKISRSDINVSITGIAGPEGFSEQKPVGTIFCAILIHGQMKYSARIPWKNRPLSREQVRETACKKIFWILIKLLKITP